MLRQTVIGVRNRIVPQIRCRSTKAEPKPNTDGNQWDLLVGVQIERLPVISKTLTKLERDYQDFLMQVEFEHSYKSDFELREEKDVAMAQLIKQGKIKIDLDGVTQQTALDLKDLWQAELSKFQPAPRITDADRKNDTKSTERKLENSLTLLVEQQIGNDKLLLLPQGKILDDETLCDAAQRIITERCGESIQTTIYGKAPCGFYKYKYPKEVRNDDAVGAKVFFYRAILKAGQVDKSRGNFAWLDKTELFEKLNELSGYKRSLSKFIV